MRKIPTRKVATIHLWHIVVAAVLLVMILLGLFWWNVTGQVNRANGRAEAEEQKNELLQNSLNDLRTRSDQDRQFFELVRELIVTPITGPEHQKLQQKLKNFKFSVPPKEAPVPNTKS